eukprot:m.191728 g.191728  ORF g.191728 m.191728 type:complete len:521 (+) comp16761_c5_seq1:100-1662(+)
MDAVVEKIVELYEENEKRLYSDNPESDEGARRGYEDLNLAVGFVEHATQAAKQAADAKVDEETIIAALLHDIGWLAPKPSDSSLLTTSDESVWLAKHDVVGGQILRAKGFSDRLSRLVEGHVQAKRYLTFKEDGYYDSLSEGSKFTLKHQGGIMTAEEATAFEQDADFELYCQIRRWDENAKIKDLEVPDVRSYKDMMKHCLAGALWADRRGFSAADIVTDAMLDFFNTQGYIVIRNWLTEAEVAMLPAYAEEVAKMRPGSCKPGPFHTYELTTSGQKVLSRTECFTNGKDENGVGAFLAYGRLKAICERLRGNREQALLKDKINYKLAGAGGYIAHQDGYWQVLPAGVEEQDFLNGDAEKRPKLDDVTLERTRLLQDEEVCVCMIAVDSSDMTNGAPSVAPKWNQRGWLGLNARDATLDAGLTPVDVSPDDLDWKDVELQPGDVLIYGNLMPHKSAPNTSSKDRRALFAIYGDVGTVGPQLRERYYAYEALHRRANNSAAESGRANRYFVGNPVHVGDQ